MSSICSHCGNEFIKKSPTHRYCSNKCAFISRIKISDNGCWDWLGPKCHKYGSIGIYIDDCKNQVVRLVHRFSYEFYRGEIPKGKYVCHICDNPLCVNPEHLFLGTQFENMQDCIKKGRFTKHKPTDFERQMHTQLMRGINNPKAKLTSVQVIEIYRDILSSNGELAAKFGVSRSTISRIKTGKIWGYIQAINHKNS